MRKLLLLAALILGAVALTPIAAQATGPSAVCEPSGGTEVDLTADSGSATTFTLAAGSADGGHYHPVPYVNDGTVVVPANTTYDNFTYEATYAAWADTVGGNFELVISASGMSTVTCSYTIRPWLTSTFNVWDDFESASDGSSLAGRTPPVTVSSHTWTDYNGVFTLDDMSGDMSGEGAVGPNGKKFLYSYVDQDQDGDYTLTSLVRLSPTENRAALGIMGNWYDDDNQIWAKVEVTQQWTNGKLIMGTQEDVTFSGNTPTYGAGVIHSTRCGVDSLGLFNGDWIWLQLQVDEAAGANGRDEWTARAWKASGASTAWLVDPVVGGTTPLATCSYELDTEEQAGFGDRGEGVGLRFKIDDTGSTPEDDGLSRWGIFTSIDSGTTAAVIG